ncbi:MAG: hypothetical protein BWY82_02013 [Verrucomicrobia bacterium ADurb.Bin474]|nr:MAG: hypothetical protein BWY82_02013 [Verrucomicrobia bacterium ADurb.Bin474]
MQAGPGSDPDASIPGLDHGEDVIHACTEFCPALAIELVEGVGVSHPDFVLFHFQDAQGGGPGVLLFLRPLHLLAVPEPLEMLAGIAADEDLPVVPFVNAEDAHADRSRRNQIDEFLVFVGFQLGVFFLIIHDHEQRMGLARGDIITMQFFWMIHQFENSGDWIKHAERLRLERRISDLDGQTSIGQEYQRLWFILPNCKRDRLGIFLPLAAIVFQ